MFLIILTGIMVESLENQIKKQPPLKVHVDEEVSFVTTLAS